MKLYTEEQVRKAIDMARDRNMEYTKYGIFDDLIPIELPSDEEIEESSPKVNQHSHDYYFGEKVGYTDGAIWMREQIINKSK